MSRPLGNEELEAFRSEPEFDFRRYFFVFLRYYRLILLFIILSIAFTAVSLRNNEDVFSSFAQIVIEKEPYTFGTPYFRMPKGIDANMIQMWMYSPPVMEKIYAILGETPAEDMRGYNVSFPIRDQMEQSDTLLVSIRARAKNPDLAFKMSDAMITAFQSQLMDNQLQKTRASMAWMVERLADQKKKVETAEQRFQEYKQSIQVLSFEDQRAAETTKILNVQNELNLITNQRLQLEVDYNKLNNALRKSREISDLTFKSQNVDPITGLLQEYNTIHVQKQEKLKVFKSKHPEILDLDTQLQTLRARIEKEKRNAVTSLQISLQTLQERESVLSRSMGEHRQRAQEIAQNEWQYRILERELLTNEELYHSLMTEIEGTDLRGKIESTSVTVINPPSMPPVPDPKGHLRNFLKAILIGLVLGAGLALTLDYFEMSIRTPEELERRLGIPVIGVIPEKD